MNQISLSPFANFNSAVPWGLWVAIYVWLVGISAGSFMLVVLGNMLNNSYLKKITRIGIVLALATLLVGLLSILIDLGHMERFYKLFVSPSFKSVMAQMVWIYNFYFLLLVVMLFKLNKKISKLFLIFAFIFSLAVIINESMLFAKLPGKLWHSSLFPLHFLTSSLVAAMGALLFVVVLLKPKSEKKELLVGLSKVALPLVVINLAIEIFDIFSHGAMNQQNNLLLMIGNAVVIFLLLRKDYLAISIAGFISLWGILFYKYSSLISAQLIEPYKGYGLSYVEHKLQYIYTPTSFEWAVSVFLILAVIVIFYFLYNIFPLTKEE